MKFFKINLAILTALMFAGLTKLHAQTEMMLTGLATNPSGYHPTVPSSNLELGIFNPGANIPGGVMKINAILPNNVKFALNNVTPPAGWSFVLKSNDQELDIVRTSLFESGDFNEFALPILVLAPVTAPNNQYTAQVIQNGTPAAPYNNWVPLAPTSWPSGTIVVTTPLPVAFGAFDVKANGCSADLTWSTTFERNNDFFEVERSNNGTRFEVVGKVKAAGNSSSLTEYSFTDKSAKQGHNFYRIRQIDLDKRNATTHVNQVKLECIGSGIAIYPNPADNVFYIKGLTNKSTVEVVNVLGQIVLTKQTENALEGVSIASLPAGAYQINVVQNKVAVFSTKLVKN